MKMQNARTEQDGIDQKRKGIGFFKETIHSMLRRCQGWDYSQPCIYMITVVLANRQSQALGEVVVDKFGEKFGDIIAEKERCTEAEQQAFVEEAVAKPSEFGRAACPQAAAYPPSRRRVAKRCPSRGAR